MVRLLHLPAGVLEALAVNYGVSLYALCLYLRVRWGRTA